MNDAGSFHSAATRIARFFAGSVTTTKVHGWRFAPEGAEPAIAMHAWIRQYRFGQGVGSA